MNPMNAAKPSPLAEKAQRQMDEEVQRQMDEIKSHILLENTRILAKGIELLCNHYEARGGVWDIKNLREFVHAQAQRAQADDKEWLLQNPYVELFKFRMSRTGKETTDLSLAECGALSAMMLMWHELNRLESFSKKREPFSSHFACYASLCDCLRNITKFDMCYIVYRGLDETRILSASSVFYDQLHSTCSEQDMARLLARKDNPKEEDVKQDYLGGNISSLRILEPDSNNQKREYLFLPLFLPADFPELHLRKERELCLVFHRDCSHDEAKRQKAQQEAQQKAGVPSELLYAVRDALFLRGSLIQALNRDFFRLLDINWERQEIEKKSRKNQIRILHISDLHVEARNVATIQGCVKALTFQETAFEEGEASEREYLENPIDFIAITGDVAQGRTTAKELEENYRHAGTIIREIAFRIWKRKTVDLRDAKNNSEESSEVLDWDWKRRVLIIPGNHDYASMNELETQFDDTKRSSVGGSPAREAGAAAKFTYYINFLRDLLDLDSQRRIADDLNELRCYDFPAESLRVNFIMLNTSMRANPRRTNKVHLSKRFLERTVGRLNRAQANHIRTDTLYVCLCHHGPTYIRNMSYLADQYYETCICNELIHRFQEQERRMSADEEGFSQDEEKLWEFALAKDRDGDVLAYEETQMWIENAYPNHVRYFSNEDTEKRREVEEWVAQKRKQSRFYKAWHYLQEMRRRHQEEIDEEYQSLLSNWKLADTLSEADKKSCLGSLHTLRDLKPDVFLLSGHVHKWEDSRKDGAPVEEICFTADRFYKTLFLRDSESGELKRMEQLNFGICAISRSMDGTEDEDDSLYHFYSAFFLREQPSSYTQQRILRMDGKNPDDGQRYRGNQRIEKMGFSLRIQNHSNVKNPKIEDEVK